LTKSTWLRIGIAAAGLGSLIAAIFVPPAAPALFILGPSLLGYAMKAPGTFSGKQLAEHGQKVAEAIVPDILETVAAHAGKPAATVAKVAGEAAAAAAAKVLQTKGQ